jgi:hypothetical protein
VKTLVAGVGAALLGFAALTFAALPAAADDPPVTPDPTQTQSLIPPPLEAGTAPPPLTPAQPPVSEPPSASPDPVLTVTCSVIDVIVQSPPNSGRTFAVATGRAEKGTPAFNEPPSNGTLGPWFEFKNTLDPGQATAYVLELRAADGTVLWSRSGTTVPCAAEPLIKYALAYDVEPVTTCGKTLADIQFPSTPGIVYSYDEWNAYARRQPGWIWDNDMYYNRAHPWLPIHNSSTDQLAWLPRSAFFTDAPGCPRYATVPPPLSQVPVDPAWKGIGAATTAARPTTAVAPGSGAAAADGAVNAQTPSTGLTPSHSPSPMEGRTASPEPTPSPTPAVQAQQPRVATTTGLGVAGGVTGACVLAAAGAFVVRKRMRPTPNDVVVLDEELD